MSNYFNKRRFLSPAKQTPKGDRMLKKNRFESPDDYINSVLNDSFNQSVTLDQSDSADEEDNQTAKPKSSWTASIRNLGCNFSEALEGCFHPTNEEVGLNIDLQSLRQNNAYLQQRLEAVSNATNIHEQQSLHNNNTSTVSTTALFYKNQYDSIQNQLEMMTETASMYERQLSDYNESEFKWKEKKSCMFNGLTS